MDIDPSGSEHGGGGQSRGRLPPQDLAAERSVLGAMLLEADAANEVVAALSPEDFYRGQHGFIFAAMKALYERSEAIDEITVAAQLKQDQKLDAAGGVAALSTLSESVPTAANVSHYLRIVKSRATSRRLIRAATEIAAAGYAGEVSVDDLLGDAEAKIFQITGDRDERSLVPIRETVYDTFKAIEKFYERRDPITGVETGFVDFDKITAGLQPSDLIIVAGRPSMGKTALAMNMALNSALNNQTAVAIFSLEMSKEQLVMRMFCSEAKVDFGRLRGGFLKDDDWDRLAWAAGRLREAPVFIDDGGEATVLEIRSKCRRLKAEHNLGLVVVDYLQLMRGRRGGVDSREREISEISRGLKALAKELHLPVIALSQLNRMVESRTDKRPMLSDLRESGAIEQDADVICFVYRDEKYNPETEYKGIAEIIVGKQRNGATGTVYMKFFDNYVRFDNHTDAIGEPQEAMN